ncbi:hypothetical protein PAUR_b0558 [Pseudoalteromonas aurantia 208]|uniref:Uncharacterized protein n=1 Tax=Pseudoalteromonas aurantia 208 TaxID=1314867 RepID=A0ABR9EJR7_9GAMM|nr:hypothetical protein [Pseudoalteromonas aurantia 208]
MFCKQTYVQSNDDISFNIKALLYSNSGLLLHKSNAESEKNSFIGQIRLSRAEVR